jgi:nuclear pore complex protein Nup107
LITVVIKLLSEVSRETFLFFWWFSNILFREFALISMWRVPETPIGAHKLLAFLSEPLQQPKDNLLQLDDPDVSVNLHEFEDWV